MTISNNDNVIDSRDVIARIEELTQERDDFEPSNDNQEWADEYPDEADELAALENLADQAETYSDWNYGATLINEDYFTEYCQDLVEDIDGKIPDYVVVDWEATAENLKVDYSAVDFDGVTYYIR